MTLTPDNILEKCGVQIVEHEVISFQLVARQLFLSTYSCWVINKLDGIIGSNTGK